MILPTHLWLFGLLRLVMIVLWLAKVVVFMEVCKVLFGSFLRGVVGMGFIVAIGVIGAMGFIDFFSPDRSRAHTGQGIAYTSSLFQTVRPDESGRPQYFFSLVRPGDRTSLRALCLCSFSAFSPLIRCFFLRVVFESFSSCFRD